MMTGVVKKMIGTEKKIQKNIKEKLFIINIYLNNKIFKISKYLIIVAVFYNISLPIINFII